MSERRDQLSSRVCNALAALEMLAEGRTGGPADRDRVTGGEGHSEPSNPEGSTFDHFARKLERLCAQMEERVGEERTGRRRAPETRAQFHERVLWEHEGKPDWLAANIERVSVSLIKQIRWKAGRQTNNGELKDAA